MFLRSSKLKCVTRAAFYAEQHLYHMNAPFHASSEAEDNKVFLGKAFFLKRCFLLKDVHSFCELCNIPDPIHRDLQEAQRHGFSACRVPELLYAGLFPAIIGTRFRGSIYVSQKLQFRNPVLVEESLHAEVKAIHLRKFSDKYRVEFATTCWKEGKTILVVEGVAVALLPSLLTRS